MKEYEIVVLTRSFPDYGLQAGDVGTIVHVHVPGEAFEVEFVSGDASTVALLTLNSADLRAVAGREILHVRELSS